MNPNRLILFDLDGVLVTDGCGDTSIGHEILCIHHDSAKLLCSLQLPVAILTHRTRFEADQILRALNLSNGDLAGYYTASDLLRSALFHGQILSLLRSGMRKSLVLPIVRESLGLRACDLAFIDDKPDNVDDMAEHRVGLTILVPSASLTSGLLSTFDLEEALNAVITWAAQSDGYDKRPTRVELRSISRPIDESAYSGIIMQGHGFDLFGRFRRMSRSLRRLFS